MDFKEFLFSLDDEAEMFNFVGGRWEFIYNVEYRNTVDNGEFRGWIVRVKFDNSPNKK